MGIVFQEREYQTEAANALYKALKADSKCNPLIVLPTATGKSIVLCDIVDLIISDNPHENILVLSHDKRILKQNHKALEDYYEIEIGLYSSGLKSRTINKITVAGIQSVHRKPELFEKFGIILVDECHLITIEQTGMYRRFLNALNDHQVGGLTATPFRTNHGYIYEGEGALFNKCVYDLSETKAFNKLVKQGYLQELFSKPTKLKLDVSKIKKVAGDYSKKDLSVSLDRAHITEAAILESIYYGKKFKKWLCFAIDIKHAEHIKERFEAHEIPSAVIHSRMTDSAVDEILADFKTGKYRVLINVNMLTTGFDDPEIDLIILLRPTMSPVLHVQMIGRGLRVIYKPGMPIDTAKQRRKAIKKGGKPFTLVLDFAGNVERLGPINQMEIKQKRKTKGGGEPVVRECPDCGIYNHISLKACANCGFEFPVKEKIKTTADKKEIVARKKLKRITKGKKKWYRVTAVSYMVKKNFRRPDSFQVVYVCGASRITEQLRLLDSGYMKAKALNWVRYRWDDRNGEMPRSPFKLFQNTKHLPRVKKILVDTRGDRPQIIDVQFYDWPKQEKLPF